MSDIVSAMGSLAVGRNETHPTGLFTTQPTIFAKRNAPHVSPHKASPREVILKNRQSLKTRDTELFIAANPNLPGVSVQKLQLKEEKNQI